MPRFVFRYETLLGHRRQLEDQRQRELATQVRSQMIYTDQLRAMQQDITRSKQDLGQALVGKVDLSQVGGFTRFNHESTVRGRQLVTKLAQMEKHVEAARRKLLEATQQRKALELLRERDEKQWRLEQDRRETAALDDLANQSYGRALLESQRREAGERAA